MPGDKLAPEGPGRGYIYNSDDVDVLLDTQSVDTNSPAKTDDSLLKAF